MPLGSPRHARLRLARGFPSSAARKRRRGAHFAKRGVVLTAAARARFDALPDNFLAFIAVPERFFARPEAEAA